jgi:hypothetical protein
VSRSKAVISSGVGGNPVKSKVTRRRSVLLSAGGLNEICLLSSRASRNESIALCVRPRTSGGADLATELFKEDLIDEVVLKVNPLLLGSGIPLMSNIGRQVDLELIDSKVYNGGVVLLSYRVKK